MNVKQLPRRNIPNVGEAIAPIIVEHMLNRFSLAWLAKNAISIPIAPNIKTGKILKNNIKT